MILSLENISKNVLLVGLALLLFRNSSFAVTHIPQPFEICFIIVSLLALVDLIKNKKFKDFFSSVPKDIWIAVSTLLFSIALGWVIAVTFRHLPSTLNMVFELVAFLVAACTGVLVLYYSKNDPSYIKKCLYALSVPVIYVVLVPFPRAAFFLHLAQDGTFSGFTDNVNIISKALLVPLFFFITHALLEQKKRWHRIGAIILSIALTTLLFWTTERATVVAFVLGSTAVWVAISFIDRDWKKIVLNAGILLLIAVFGVLALPQEGKKAAANRILHFDGNQVPYVQLKDKTTAEVVQTALKDKILVAVQSEAEEKEKTVEPFTLTTLFDAEKSPEPRFQIWEHYLSVIFHNPLGLGPNTHMTARVPYAKGEFVNPGPHNTYLELWLWGGIVGLVSFLYILWSAFRRLLSTIRHKTGQPFVFVLLGSLVAFSIAIFFNDSVSSVWFWTIVALSFRV